MQLRSISGFCLFLTIISCEAWAPPPRASSSETGRPLILDVSTADMNHDQRLDLLYQASEIYVESVYDLAGVTQRQLDSLVQFQYNHFSERYLSPSSGQLFLQYDQENDIVGCIGLNWRPIRNRQCPLVADLCVDPRHRRQGIAQCLVKHLERGLLYQNVPDLYLYVEPHNHAAVSLYKRLGFQLFEDVGEGFVKELYQGKLVSQPTTFWLLQKQLQ